MYVVCILYVCSAVQTTEQRDEGLALPRESSSGSLAATVAMPRSEDGRTMIAASPPPPRVTLSVTATLNSTSATVCTTACVATVTTCVQLTSAMTSVVTSSLTSVSRRSHVTVVSSSTAAAIRCFARPASKLPSPAARSHATIDQLPAEIATTNGVINDHNNDDDDSSSSVPRSSRVVALASPRNVDESRDLLHTSNSVELPPLATGGVSQPPLKSFGNKSDEKVSVHSAVDSFRRGDVGVAGVKENVPPARTVAGTRLERVGRPSSAPHQHPAATQRPGCASRGVVVAVTGSSAAAARVGRTPPPPVPTRTSSVLSGGAVRSPRPPPLPAKPNGHLFQPPRATPPPPARSAPESAISNGLSRRSAFQRDRVTASSAKVITETEIL